MGVPRYWQNCVYATMGCYESQQCTCVFCTRHKISWLAERQPFVRVLLLHIRLSLYFQSLTHRHVSIFCSSLTQTFSMYSVSLFSCPQARYLYRIERLLLPGRPVKTAARGGRQLDFLRTVTAPLICCSNHEPLCCACHVAWSDYTFSSSVSD